MGGREARAALLFVLISLAAGAAYRSWIAPEGPSFAERLRAMEEASAADAERGLDAAGLAEGTAVGRPDFGGRDLGAAAIGEARGARHAGSARERPAPLGTLQVDRATAAEWERLPGIGPALAARIVAERAAHGPFLAPEGLLRVRGIGPKTLERLRPFLRSGPADSASLFAN
ncbi:MAG TPA: helix-hairpin-helix domain-containing protein [Candidatus Eisenbacteria bacterium]|nr:helix-hairpin-helix domain-containing protein [Candidatus Eisenbacteria bacterium]